MRVFVETPQGTGPFPGVVVIQHGAGVDGFIQTVVLRLADQGYVAAAPDLYHRQKDNAPAEPMSRIRQLKDTEITTDVEATVRYLQGLRAPGVASVGITGFCMGGRVVYLMASQIPAFEAAASFYPGSTMLPWGTGPTPFDLTAKISCPVAGFFGKDDANPTQEDVQKLDAELTKHGKPHAFHSYDGAGHGFMNWNGQAYQEQAAKDAWGKLLAFFAQHLKTPVATPPLG